MLNSVNGILAIAPEQLSARLYQIVRFGVYGRQIHAAERSDLDRVALIPDFSRKRRRVPVGRLRPYAYQIHAAARSDLDGISPHPRHPSAPFALYPGQSPGAQEDPIPRSRSAGEGTLSCKREKGADASQRGMITVTDLLATTLWFEFSTSNTRVCLPGATLLAGQIKAHLSGLLAE